MTGYRLPALLLLACLLAGCSRAIPQVAFEGRRHDKFPGRSYPGEEDYRIGTGDELTLSVFRFDEFNGKVKVDRRGFIRLPLVYDEVRAEGLTILELEAAVAAGLAPYVSGGARVKAELTTPSSRFVYVMGAVTAPGKYAMRDERLYVQEVIARAGWPLRNAALQRTELVRSDPDSNASRRIRLKDILYRGDLTENYEIQPGDIVWVPYTRLTEFSNRLREILEPIFLLNSLDRGVSRLSRAPTSFRDTSNRSWEYEGDGYGGY